MIWQCMGNGFCSFKVLTKTQTMCKNDNNVLGLCCKSACPLANSNYATVREHKGIVYLCKKVVERAAYPHKLWEKVRLPANYDEALLKIDELLPYWNSVQVHRCKQRYTKIYQYIERCRKMATKMRNKKIITLPRKMERREKAREKKALLAAKLENQIELEVLNRVKQGVYASKYKFESINVFEDALTKEVDEMEEQVIPGPSKRRKIVVEAAPRRASSKYVEDIEDLGNESASSESDGFWDSEDEPDDSESHDSTYSATNKEYV